MAIFNSYVKLPEGNLNSGHFEVILSTMKYSLRWLSHCTLADMARPDLRNFEMVFPRSDFWERSSPTTGPYSVKNYPLVN
jgi:hypothetical protein